MSTYQRTRRRRAEINIVPLIDVLVVLIFFFLMTMQFRDLSSLDITPPEMETAGRSDFPAKPIVIGIDENGDLYLDDQPLARERLAEELSARHAEAPEVSVLIFAAEETPLRFVTEVMDHARKTGFQSLRLQTR